MNLRQIGSGAEEFVKGELEKSGMEIRQMNFHSRAGEIDIIARDGKYLVFVEVKYRKSVHAGKGAEAVGVTKQRKICRTALFYMTKFGFATDTPVRFDVAEVWGNDDLNLHYIKNAFDFIM